MESFYQRWLHQNQVENERGLHLLQTQTNLVSELQPVEIEVNKKPKI
jgi:hypothetical protein